MTRKQKWTAACLTVAAAVITISQTWSIIAAPPDIIGAIILGCGYFMFCIVVIWRETIDERRMTTITLAALENAIGADANDTLRDLIDQIERNKGEKT